MIACPSARVERERLSSFAGMDMLSFPKKTAGKLALMQENLTHGFNGVASEGSIFTNKSSKNNKIKIKNSTFL